MKSIEIGTSGVQASRLALGVMRISSLSPQEAMTSLRLALDGGIDFFDTADVYGRGVSSQVFGDALKGLGVKREDITIQTKFGIVQREGADTDISNDFSQQHLWDSLNKELRCLGTDYVDFALLHRPDELVDLDELAETFNQMQSSGKVRHFGVSNMNPRQIDLLQSVLDQKLQVNQMPFGLMHPEMIRPGLNVALPNDSAIDRDGGVLPYSRLHKMTIQAWSPFQYGFFEGHFVDNPKFPELNQALAGLAAKYGTNKSAIAAAWILRHPAHIQVLLGALEPPLLSQMLEAGDLELERQEWWDLFVAAGNILP